MKVAAQVYRRYNADPSAEIPANSFLGWVDTAVDLRVEQSMLVCMHFWNLGLDERLAYGADVPYAGWYRVCEYIGRTVPIVRNVMPPLLAVARAGRLTVAHVGINDFARKYCGYGAAERLAGPEAAPPAGAPACPARDAWRQQRMVEGCGQHNIAAMSGVAALLDFPQEVTPLNDEPVVLTSHQLNAVCRQRGIWHLMYCGYCINACLLDSPCGMVDMRRLGYCCSAVRDATTAGELKETAREEWAKELALSSVDYVFRSADLVAALGCEEL